MATSTRGRIGTAGRVGNKTNCPPQYKSTACTFGGKINSFRTLLGQTQGPARFTRPTTSTLNSFANWINKGAIVQICTTAQVNKWANATNCNFNTKNATVASCKNVLGKKFGKAAIKAVARTKSGSFMVVTPPTNKGKVFCFPK